MLETEKFLRRSHGHDAASFEQDDTRSEQQSFAQVVSDEDDGFAEAAGEGAEFTLQLGARDGVERAEWLVHEQNRGIGGKSAGNAHALALAARKFAGAAVRKFSWLKPHKYKEFTDTSRRAAAVPFFQRGNESDVFRDGEMRKEAGLLNDVTDASAEAYEIPIAGGALLDQDFTLRRK